MRQLLYVGMIERMKDDASKLLPQHNENFYSLQIRNQLAKLLSSVAVRARKEESEKEAHEDKNIGKCPRCGTVVSSPRRKWMEDGWLEIGLFDCPKCEKPFREIIKEKDY